LNIEICDLFEIWCLRFGFFLCLSFFFDQTVRFFGRRQGGHPKPDTS